MFCYAQLCYDTSDGGKEFRTSTSVNLAYWHTYKHAALSVWDAFLPEVWGPLYHNLYPSSKLLRAAKGQPLPMVLAHMQIFRLAYAKFKDPLQELLRGDKLAGNMKIAALDLSCLCEFIIPTVALLHVLQCVLACF